MPYNDKQHLKGITVWHYINVVVEYTRSVQLYVTFDIYTQMLHIIVYFMYMQQKKFI